MSEKRRTLAAGKSQQRITRREFIGGASVAALSFTVVKPELVRGVDTNSKINLGMIGCGGRAGAHLRALENRIKRKGDCRIVAVSDLYQRRLRAAVERTGAKGCRDYRELLARDDVDAVFAPIPWHWHAKVCIDTCEAGKDIYIETPMANTIEDARKVYETVTRTKRILEVGNQPVCDDKYWRAREVVRSGVLGKILIMKVNYTRNSRGGQWNYPIDKDAGPESIDWPTWQGWRWGLAPERPFSRERFFRWRKFRDYGGGAASDLLCHGLGYMFVATGHEFAYQAASAGGQFVEMDRDVFDTYLTMVEFPSGYVCLMDGTMVNEQAGSDTIRGHEATLFIENDGVVVVPERPFAKEFQEKCNAAGLKGEWIDYMIRRGGAEYSVKSLRIRKKKSELSTTELLHDDFLRCVRTREKPLEGALEGYKITVAVEMGVQSYFQNRMMYFDPEKREVLKNIPPRKNQKKL